MFYVLLLPDPLHQVYKALGLGGQGKWEERECVGSLPTDKGVHLKSTDDILCGVVNKTTLKRGPLGCRNSCTQKRDHSDDDDTSASDPPQHLQASPFPEAAP